MARPNEGKCLAWRFSVSWLDPHGSSSQGTWLNVNPEEEALSREAASYAGDVGHSHPVSSPLYYDFLFRSYCALAQTFSRLWEAVEGLGGEAVGGGAGRSRREEAWKGGSGIGSFKQAASSALPLTFGLKCTQSLRGLCFPIKTPTQHSI